MGFGDMKNMMGQMYEAQKQIKQMQKELGKMRIEAESSGVKAVVDGEANLVELELDPSVMQSDSKALAKTLLKVITEAQKKAKNEVAKRAKELTGGLKIPGLG